MSGTAVLREVDDDRRADHCVEKRHLLCSCKKRIKMNKGIFSPKKNVNISERFKVVGVNRDFLLPVHLHPLHCQKCPYIAKMLNVYIQSKSRRYLCGIIY